MNRPFAFLIGLGLCLRISCAQPESYTIYSTVLQLMHPNVPEWMILNKTRAFPFCSTPARDQEALYRSMLDDYTRNAKHDTATAFSAVSFNPERTRAAVCFWVSSNGARQMLAKSDGTWNFDKAWGGNGCGGHIDVIDVIDVIGLPRRIRRHHAAKPRGRFAPAVH